MRSRRWLLGAVLLLLVLGTGSRSRPVVKAEPMEESVLLSVWVPSLCEHPAGRLVNGRLPGIEREFGEVVMAHLNGWAGPDTVAYGDITGDDRADAAAVVTCDRGGVAWPDSVQLYAAGGRWLGGVELADVVPSGNGRASAWSVAIHDRVVTVRWATGREDDAGCCSSLDAEAAVTVQGGRLRVERVAVFDEMQVLDDLLAAVAAADRVAAAQYAPPSTVEKLTESAAVGRPRVAGCEPWSDPDRLARACVVEFSSQRRIRLFLEKTGFRAWHVYTHESA